MTTNVVYYVRTVNADGTLHSEGGPIGGWTVLSEAQDRAALLAANGATDGKTVRVVSVTTTVVEALVS